MMPTESILIVDDSPTATSLMKLYLQKLGYTISGSADNAEIALQLVQKFKPNLVLMDIYLGEGMNGIETADIIRAKFNIPVIYVTSYSDEDTLKRAKLTMPFGFINKPYRENDLRVNIEIALSRNSAINSKNLRDPAIMDMGNEALELTLLSETLDHLITGVIVVDEELQIFFNNKSANKICSENFPIKIKNNALMCATPKIKRDLLDQINKNSNEMVSINYKNLDFHILIFPLTNPENYNLNQQSSSILFIFDTVHDSARFEEVVRTI